MCRQSFLLRGTQRKRRIVFNVCVGSFCEIYTIAEKVFMMDSRGNCRAKSFGNLGSVSKIFLKCKRLREILLSCPRFDYAGSLKTCISSFHMILPRCRLHPYGNWIPYFVVLMPILNVGLPLLDKIFPRYLPFSNPLPFLFLWGEFFMPRVSFLLNTPRRI